MADEIDLKIMPDLVRDAFTVALGVSFKMAEGMKRPLYCMEAVVKEMQAVVRIPPETPAGLSASLGAVRQNLKDKSADWIGDFMAEGAKFTEESK